MNQVTDEWVSVLMVTERVTKLIHNISFRVKLHVNTTAVLEELQTCRQYETEAPNEWMITYERERSRGLGILHTDEKVAVRQNASVAADTVR